MTKLRYDTIREHCYSPFDLTRLSDSLQSTGQPCHLQHLVADGSDSVRLAQVKDVIETVVRGRKYEVLLLRCQGKTISEISMMLDISKSAVQSHYRHAIRQVRRAMGLEPKRSEPLVQTSAVSPTV